MQEDDVRKCHTFLVMKYHVGVMEVPAQCHLLWKAQEGIRRQTQEEVWEEVSRKPSEQQRAVLSLATWWFE